MKADRSMKDVLCGWQLAIDCAIARLISKSRSKVEQEELEVACEAKLGLKAIAKFFEVEL